MSQIVVLDIETPNRYNHRICSIGLTSIIDGKIEETYYSLVNPEVEFDFMNINIHGITSQKVQDAPIFPMVWDEIGGLHELSSLGAVCQDRVTKLTNYVVIGGQGSSNWYAGNYGTKVKKALELQSKGIPIQIICEVDFYNALKGD